jgi:hypothetical protein
MPSTLTPTCPLCGLRFSSEPLLELHIREDHRRHDHAEAGRGGPAGTPASQHRDAVPGDGDGPASSLPSAANEVTAMTAAGQRHRPRAGRARAALRGMIRAIRHANEELLLASELMFRPPGARRSRKEEPATRAHATTGTQPFDRAA